MAPKSKKSGGMNGNPPILTSPFATGSPANVNLQNMQNPFSYERSQNAPPPISRQPNFRQMKTLLTDLMQEKVGEVMNMLTWYEENTNIYKNEIDEYDNPSTTPERRADIMKVMKERLAGYMNQIPQTQNIGGKGRGKSRKASRV